MGSRPDWRFLVQAEDAGEKKAPLKELGAAWKLASGNFSCRVTLPDGEVIRFLMVPNAPRKAVPIRRSDTPEAA